MRAILVCVDCSDLLQITLPYNRQHFSEICVVTSLEDYKTVEVAKQVEVFQTNAFYENGANFNKFLALEQGLNHFGREGWIAILDADILWPKDIPYLDLRIGKLYSPFRRMFRDLSKPIPSEEAWGNYELYPDREFAGYTQLFHAHDLVLRSTPWHETNWKHAGGGDSFFQKKWEEQNKIRLPFEVLHLGLPGTNWCGRATAFLNGELPEDARKKRKLLREYMEIRKKTSSFSHEKLSD